MKKLSTLLILCGLFVATSGCSIKAGFKVGTNRPADNYQLPLKYEGYDADEYK